MSLFCTIPLAYFENNKTSLLDAVYIASLSKENGCRVVVHGANSIVVYDCYRWDKENTALLLLLKPNVEISILASLNSISGFKIIISEKNEPILIVRVILLLVTITMLLILFLSLPIE